MFLVQPCLSTAAVEGLQSFKLVIRFVYVVAYQIKLVTLRGVCHKTAPDDIKLQQKPFSTSRLIVITVVGSIQYLHCIITLSVNIATEEPQPIDITI